MLTWISTAARGWCRPSVFVHVQICTVDVYMWWLFLVFYSLWCVMSYYPDWTVVHMVNYNCLVLASYTLLLCKCQWYIYQCWMSGWSRWSKRVEIRTNKYATSIWHDLMDQISRYRYSSTGTIFVRPRVKIPAELNHRCTWDENYPIVRDMGWP